MNQTIRIIAGVVFFLLSVVAISLIRINPTSSTPTRSTETRVAGIMEPLLSGIIISQEITARKNYLCRVEFIFTHSGRNNTNGNTLLVLDADYKTIYKLNFSSSTVKEGDWTSFLFEKPVYVGEGNRAHICLLSEDASTDNTISPIYNRTDSIGALYSSTVIANDLPGTLKNRLRQYPGSIILKTYETDHSQFWLMKIFLYFLGTLFTCFIIWFSWIKSTLSRIRIMPEWVFLFIAIPVATIFAFITPPLQVPDESNHFYKAFVIADFNIFKQDKTVPASIVKLDSSFGHLHFLAGEKTSMSAITAHLGVKLNPGARVSISPPDYTLPYLPQAIGVFIGKMFDSSPLILMYLGRIFNLLFSVTIMFFAIRIIPQFKWIFLLLALMPKTLFLFGSLSYDSLTISLSFLTMAVFFYYAFACERKLSLKDLAVMALLVLLLLFCKPPYFLLGLLFFFIPPKKFGPVYRYILIAIGVIAIGGLIIAGPRAYKYYSTRNNVVQVDASSAEPSLIRPDDQMKVILNDIPAYFKLMAKSGFVDNRPYIVESFVGLLGYIDVKLPDMLTYSYLAILLLTALVLSGENVRLGIAKKTLLLILLFATFVIVETAMYIYATRPGRDQIFGVQGRYFIPMAPLFFMLLYNKFINPKLNLLFSPRLKEYKKAKAKVKPLIYKEITENEHLFDKSYFMLITCFSVFTLLFSIYITLIRYYNI